MPKENLTTLRVLVVKDILEPKDLEKMKKTPAFAISLLGVDASISELRTSGWTDQLETIVGYIELPKADEDKIKKLFWKRRCLCFELKKACGCMACSVMEAS